MYVCVCIYIYIHIFVERDRDRDRDRGTYIYIYIYIHVYVYVCIYIYIYIYTHIDGRLPLHLHHAGLRDEGEHLCQRHINKVVSNNNKYENFGFGGIKRPF